MKKILIIVVPLLILGGAGAFVGFKYLGKSADEAVQQEEIKEPELSQYPLETFIVNLSGDDGRRYLKAKVTLEIYQDKLEVIDKNLYKIRDALIILLSNKTFRDINDTAGKFSLREEMKSALDKVVGKEAVTEVYLIEFVVQ